jgi:hypothetical protein
MQQHIEVAPRGHEDNAPPVSVDAHGFQVSSAGRADFFVVETVAGGVGLGANGLFQHLSLRGSRKLAQVQ